MSGKIQNLQNQVGHLQLLLKARNEEKQKMTTELQKRDARILDLENKLAAATSTAA